MLIFGTVGGLMALLTGMSLMVASTIRLNLTD